MGAPKNRKYKRSWKNLLLDAKYQLSFTLLMVGLCAVVMVLLGRQVMDAADKATTVSVDNVVGAMMVACQDPAELAQGTASTVVVEDEPLEAAPDAPAPTPAAGGPGERVIELGESTMRSVVSPEARARYERCRAEHTATIDRLEAGHTRILWVLVGSGALLCLGLFVYGIKMTHRVAGPLHKVSMYFAKMRDGRYDELYELRKGDQLVAFYEHFKEAHEGMRNVEERDAQVLRELLAEAEQAGIASRSPEVAEALEQLRAILARKEAGDVEA